MPAFVYRALADNSRLVGHTEVILQPRSRSKANRRGTWTINALTGQVKSWYGTV